MTDATTPADAASLGDELVAALEGLDRASRACVRATNSWRDAAAGLPDAEARALAFAAADRGLARSDELRALLSLVDEVSLTVGTPALTVGTVLGQAAGGVGGRYPDLVIRVRSELATQRRGLAPSAAAALAVAVCGALGNAARHGPPNGPVTVRATAAARDLRVSVLSAGDVDVIVPGRGMLVAADLVTRAGGVHRVATSSAGVTVNVLVPLVGRWPFAIPSRRSARAVVRSANGVMAQAALRIQGAHGMAAPLREARWLVGGPASTELGEALDGLERAAEALSSQLGSGAATAS